MHIDGILLKERLTEGEQEEEEEGEEYVRRLEAFI